MPLIVIAAYWAVCHLLILICMTVLIGLRLWAPHNALARRVTDGLGVAGAAPFNLAIVGLAIAQCIIYLWIPNFTDYGEPVIPLLAGNILQGAPIYSDPHSGHAVIGSNYGPYIFLFQLPGIKLFPTIFSSKLVGVSAALLEITLFFMIIRSRSASFGRALSMTALMIIVRRQNI